jgi:EF-1 guanine nucleotide exchange domain
MDCIDRGAAAKSVVTMDVKPWDDTTDMTQLEANVRAIEKGTSSLSLMGIDLANTVFFRWACLGCLYLGGCRVRYQEAPDQSGC